MIRIHNYLSREPVVVFVVYQVEIAENADKNKKSNDKKSKNKNQKRKIE